MRDFFISYNHADQGWAEWIAWHLEAGGLHHADPGVGHPTWQQLYSGDGSGISVHPPHDCRPLARLPDLALHRARIWRRAAPRPHRRETVLVPVRVRECQPEGWLASVVYIDLLGQPPEEAQKRLLAGHPS